MALNQITYSNKADLNSNPSVPATNKVQASDMNEIKTVVNACISQVDGVSGTILWTNQSPNQAFTAQTIQLQANTCDMLLIIFRRVYSNSGTLLSIITRKGFGTMITNVAPDGELLRRGIDFSSGEVYSVQQCTKGVSTQANDYLVPIYVIGYDTGLF